MSELAVSSVSFAQVAGNAQMGGTSRAIFFRREDLPQDKKQWESIFLGCIGSPDPYGRQLDGMGGGISSLSKVCVVGPSTRPDADVDYTFVALGVRDAEVDYSSNCGNMSTAVGPFAVDSGMLDNVPSSGVHESITVRIHNTNTGKLIHASFPVVDGEAAASGEFAMDGVAGTAARVRLDFVEPGGSRTGNLLPTGNVIDEVSGIQATLLDAGNPCCFVRSADLGIVNGRLSPQEIENRPELTERLDEIRRQAGVMMGLASSPEEVPGSVPKIAMISPSNEASGRSVVVRAMSVGQPHRAIPVTVALATAAAAKLPGTTVHACVSGRPAADEELNIQHAGGQLLVDARYDDAGHLVLATVFRSARRLMDGLIYWK
ncbi:hypothetical protein DL546_004314 [Coniochaeta pulveracea]|uniref:PrpF family protein n=1 Tax=Coniochaeta pulveracea TaxID=177199 RepID=A0A420Y3X5_9PEZI|nr:hypothetical protein DL546_004314 [Coniochaeta pulveracea]